MAVALCVVYLIHTLLLSLVPVTWQIGTIFPTQWIKRLFFSPPYVFPTVHCWPDENKTMLESRRQISVRDLCFHAKKPLGGHRTKTNQRGFKFWSEPYKGYKSLYMALTKISALLKSLYMAVILVNLPTVQLIVALGNDRIDKSDRIWLDRILTDMSPWRGTKQEVACLYEFKTLQSFWKHGGHVILEREVSYEVHLLHDPRWTVLYHKFTR